MGSGPSPLSCGIFLPPPLLQAFLLLIAGCVPMLLPSPASLFIYRSCGKWVFPPLQCSFPPTATFTRFPAPGCWACAATLAFSSQLVYLQFHEGFPLPSLRCSGCVALFATCVLCCYCLLFSFFFPEWGLVCPGGYADLAQGCLWEYCVWLRSPCGPCLPKLSGRWHLAVVWEPSWFLHLMWSGDAMRRLEVWRSQSFASSR
jgi:hypothetical protein